MTSQLANPSPEALLAEIAALREEIAILQHEKADLELLMEMTTEYSDDMTEDLYTAVETTQRESEERFKIITNTVPVPIIVSRAADDTIVYANAAAGEITGVSDKAMSGRKIVEFYSNSQEREQVLTTVHEHGFVNNWQFQGKRTNALPFWATVFIRPLLFNDEPCLLEAYHDLTTHKQAEAEILRLQHLLQNITDSMPSALITLDVSGRILTLNPAAEDLTGQATDQVQGQSLWQICPDLTRYRDLFEQVLQERRVAHWHRDELTTQAGTVYHDVSVFPLETNDIDGIVLRIDNVTQRVQLEEMMLQAAKMASVGGLAAGIAHEINNPLSGMIQSAQVLQLAFNTQRTRTRERLQTFDIDPDQLERYLKELNLLEYLSGMRTTGERAAKIVTDLLNFARKSSSKAAPQDLNKLVAQALALASTDYDLKKRFDFRDLDVICELAADLPQVICDAQQIEQVILNLVSNAAQALAGKRAEQGRKKGRLMLRTALAASPSFVRVEVEDNGPGIPEEVRTRLFDPFFTTKAMGEGVGLGLWICWSIVVERHNGQIWVEPGTDGGSRLVFELPAGEE